jgi:hypothetical protein
VTTPYQRRAEPIPVTVVIGTRKVDDLLAVPGNRQVAVIRIEPPEHDHGVGVQCLACAARGDVRAMLFDLLEGARLGLREPFTGVIVDATALPDAAEVADRIVPGKLPAFGLRDHAVAKNFRLERIIR